MSTFVHTSAFSKLLSGPFGRLGYNWDDPDRVDAACNQKLSFKSKPKPTVDLSFEKKLETSEKTEGEGEGQRFVYTDAEKTKSVLKINHETNDINSTWTFANDKLVGEASGTVLNDDWKVKAGVGFETKQVKGEWRGAGFLDMQSPEMGGAVAALQVYAQYDQKSEVKVEPHFNLLFSDEFNLGAGLKFTGSEMKECWPQVVYAPKDDKDKRYWFRADVTRKVAAAGCDQSIRDGIQHSFEARYTHESTDGVKGTPVSIHSGLEYDLSDKTSLSFASNHASDHDCEMEVTHQIDGNWTVSASQSFDCSKVAGKEARPYHLGFTAAYKL